jgi:hypothetical protein
VGLEFIFGASQVVNGMIMNWLARLMEEHTLYLF